MFCSPSVAIRLCEDWNNFDAAAVMYEASGDTANALDCRLRAIQNARQLSVDQEVQRVLELVGSHVAGSESGSGTSADQQADHSHTAMLLCQILEHWHSRKLPSRPLSKYLLERIPALGHAFSLILCDGTPDSQTKLAQLELDPELLIRATQERIRSLDAIDALQGTEAKLEAHVAEIKELLRKEAAAPTSSYLTFNAQLLVDLKKKGFAEASKVYQVKHDTN
eukprot:gnl/Hemi2/17399_TR5777_c0_g1_i1.p1 gnl/Hemi2/17399_TR5777_c0_g1~~gnl/Hemi2/17399_TR5777_c0_g1_i1.p1  ORF type:complete len:223 (+),score=36.73 gnl/Hemi2/17399_TR5777_c0_g1_i1:193-861(+)